MNQLDQLKTMTVVVADTGDMAAVRDHQPQDCTTNPSIVLNTVSTPDYAESFARAVRDGACKPDPVAAITTDLTIAVGADLAALIPGRVSTEVDARLSYDRAGSIARARELIAAYEMRGIDRERVLIKLAATWEGIQAAEQLEKEGINCNLTLIFCLAQAIACGNAGVFLVSPFVGRISDWYTQATGKSYAPEEDPGVLSVRNIYDYYKANSIDTIVMGASFRNVGQVLALAGCDRLTIAPELLAQLAGSTAPVPQKLFPDQATTRAPVPMAEGDFRWHLNEDAMATEKLAEGIRRFHADTVKLHDMIAAAL